MHARAGRRAARAAAVGAVTMAAVALATGGAHAAGPGGSEACPSNAVCLYYNSPEYGWGSFENFSPNLRGLDLSLFKFTNWGSNGSGHGVVIAMHAASIVNNTDHFVNVYLPTGRYVHYEGGYAGNLNTAYNYDVRMDT